MRTIRRVFFSLVAFAPVMAVTACSSGLTTTDSFDSSNLTSSEQEVVDQNLSDWAETFGVANPPEVEVVRFIPSSEWGATMVSCLERQGYDVTITGGSSYDIEFGPDQAAAGDLDQYVCAAQYPVRPDQTGPLNDEQKELAFEYLTVTLVECLESEGRTITDVPSRGTFMDGFDESPPWNPYAQIYATSISREDLEVLESSCPVNTPAEILYGS